MEGPPGLHPVVLEGHSPGYLPGAPFVDDMLTGGASAAESLRTGPAPTSWILGPVARGRPLTTGDAGHGDSRGTWQSPRLCLAGGRGPMGRGHILTCLEQEALNVRDVSPVWTLVASHSGESSFPQGALGP